MRTKLNGILTLLLAFVVHLSFAQDKTITGTVTDQDGLPLPGVNIVIEGTTTGTQTDFDGNYAISGSEGQTLLFSYIGQNDVRQAIGAGNTVNVQMEENAQALEEVVVTALGVKKEAQSLGYSIAKVDGDEVADKPSSDVGRLLQGKAAGVNITASNGLSGSSTNIIIRGATSITGSNQPLFVVDGVPFGSDTNNNEAFFDNATESSRFLDLDPNNIADINVLKGLSATALYGNRGRNGVILITTKNAQGGDYEGKTTVTVSSSTFFSNPHLPDYQQEYGGGFDQEFGWFFSNWGPRFGDTNPGIWSGYLNEITSDGRVFINHPFATNTVSSFITGFEDLAASQYEYKAYQSVPEFFNTGVYTSQSVGINGGNGKSSYNVTYSRVEDKSFVPGNTLRKNNLGVGGSATLGKLRVNASLNYSVTDLKSPPIAASRGSGVEGDGASLFGDLMYTPRSVDLTNIPFTRADGGSLYYRETNSIQNPNWTVENSKTGQNVDRFFGNASMTYELSENLNVSYRYGLDIYNENSFYGQNKGGIDGNQLGIYRTQKIRNAITDHNLSINYDKDISENLNLKLVGGFNSNSITFERDGVESTNQIAYGVLKHWNFTTPSTSNSFNGINFQRTTQNNTFGIYGDVSLGYKDFLYLNASARNDWTSTLESDNNRLLYPSASVSFIPTNAFDGLLSDGNGLNYLKLRAGYGSSAGFPSVYSTRNTLSLAGRAFITETGTVVSSNTTANTLGNPALEPETVTEIELGIDTRFLNNRVSLNASVFKKKTKDLITDKDLDPSTGYTLTTLNGGDLEVKGVEVDMDLHLIKSSDFNWRTNINFYADESLITRLPEGIDQIIIGNFFNADAKNAAIVGQPFGVLIGDQIQRDPDGNKVITASTGQYVINPEDVPIGDPNPDWTSSLDNDITYKGVSFGVTLDYRHGGDIFSKTATTLLNRGIIDFPYDRLGTYILPGVNPTADPNVFVPNTTQIGATDIAFSNWLGRDELEIWDGTTIRLREVRLGYSLSSKMLEKTPFASLSLTLTGSNLWYRAVNFPKGVNFDTNTLANGVGNNIGLEYFSGPSSKRYGFSIKATF